MGYLWCLWIWRYVADGNVVVVGIATVETYILLEIQINTGMDMDGEAKGFL